MTSARKTSAILVTAAAITGGALLLTQASASRGLQPRGPAAAAGDGLSLDARLRSSHVLTGGTETHMAVTLTADEAPDRAERPAVDVAVVLDRSGSMEGEKLAQAKLAARELVESLEQRDTFSVVVYGSDVQTLVPSTRASAAAIRSATAEIERIYTDGGTNLSGGLLAGRAELLGSRRRGAVTRVVLISDGQANEGIVNDDELARLAEQTSEQGVSITTLGVGLDFDERVMTRLAVSGRGNYYFAASASQLSELFHRELDRLGATVAADLDLRVTPKPGVEVLEAYGYEVVRDGAIRTIRVPDLHAGETRKVVLRLRIDASSAGTVDVADLEARFTRADRGTRRSLTAAVSAAATYDESQVAAGRDRDAVRNVERALTARAIEDATTLWEAGKADKALEVMNHRNQAAQSVAADLGDDELAKEIDGYSGSVLGNFAEAPAPSTSSGKRARKANRKDAYDLLY